MKQEQQIINALTVDVEDYYQVEAFAGVVRREDWPRWESRVERNTLKLLELFARCEVHSTFFILGWVAERHPGLVREIAAAGHEVACHGYAHRLIYEQTPEQFREDLRRAKGILEGILGAAIEGYRAPSYSITARSLWALDVLIEEGFRYDSSIFPIHHDRYGVPDAERFPHPIRRNGREIVEFPPSTVRLFGVNLPISGGGYFRLLPYQLFSRGLRHLNQRENQAAIFFIHPWEIDPAQPAVPASRLNNWRHRINLDQTLPRLEKLLGDFRFAPVCHVLSRMLPLAENRAPSSVTEIHQPQPVVQ
jgi:polysaccharide deacetylase family protein (PEP-CTERM system associated)